MRILLVEDDAMISEVLVDTLRSEHYAVDHFMDGPSAQLALETTDYDLVLLDLGLPGKNGLDVLRAARTAGLRMPVLIATARDAVADRVAGLDAGADDYVVKPYDLNELLARMRALLRRGRDMGAPAYVWQQVCLRPQLHQASRDGRTVRLSAREWAILQRLLRQPGGVVSQSQLEDSLYDWQQEINSNAVQVHIHGIRRKLGAGLIDTVRGLGYRMNVRAKSGEP